MTPETLYLDNIEDAISTMRFMKSKGIKMVLDDFGTGHSSLSCLRRFPFDKIKIDGSFVRSLVIDPGALPLAQAIITMGHSLNLVVAAEGVETAQQLKILCQEHCDEMQGFPSGKPMPSEEVDEYLRSHREPECHTSVAAT